MEGLPSGKGFPSRNGMKIEVDPMYEEEQRVRNEGAKAMQG
jgi:hypothetical protein